MAAVMIPPDAAFFWLEVQAPDGNWLRLDDPAIGGKWWNIGTTTPARIAHMAGGDAAVTYRAHFTHRDKRKKIGTSPPFQVAPSAGDDEGQEQTLEAAPDPATSEPDTPRADPASATAPRSPAPRRVNGNGHAPPYVQPKVPMAFSAPTNDPDLARFVFLRSLAQQDTDRFLTMVLSFQATQAEAERARSREAIESTRHYFASIEKNQRELQAVMLAVNKGNEVPLVVQQMQATMQQQNDAIAMVGQKLAQYDEEDATHAAQTAAMSENPNNVERVFHGIQGILGAVANSPLAEPLAELMRSKAQPGGTEAPPAQQAQQYEQEPYYPPEEQQAPTLDDFPDETPQQ